MASLSLLQSHGRENKEGHADESSRELALLVLDNILAELTRKGLALRMEEFLNAFIHHHLLLAKWRPKLLGGGEKMKSLAQVKLILAEFTLRNQIPLFENVTCIVVQGEHHGSLMKSEVTLDLELYIVYFTPF
jgi:hypothetical protein